MPRLRNRRGVFVIIFGILFIGLMGAAAVSIDMSRIWAIRNELQTSADAAALAGAIQLTPPHDTVYTADSARAFAQGNQVLASIPTVDSVQIGVWDDELATFTDGGRPANAVHVVVSHPTNNLFIGMLGVAAPRVKARATAWANAPVPVAQCVKPWSVPYVTLMSRINVARGINPPNSAQNLTRPFDPNLDMAALSSMTEAQRTFSLKIGSGTVDDDAAGGTMPGNYNAVQLPRVWDGASGTPNPEGSPSSGGAAYRANIAGPPPCYSIGVGDSLETEPGNMVGPTIQGVTQGDGVCSTLVGEDTSMPVTDSRYGDCLDGEGNVGVTVISAFHLCRTACAGRSRVGVEMVGAFTLKKIYPDKSKKNQNPAFDKSEIVGVFTPTTAGGPVAPGNTTQRRLILVR